METGRIRLDVNNMMAEMIGWQYGIAEEALARYEPCARAARQAVQKNRGTGWLGWTELPYNQDEILAQLERTAERIRSEFDAFVVLGIGGAALGPIAVQQALNHMHYNELPKGKRGGPRLYVEDNIDPERMAALLDVVDPKTTCFNVITKSGATAETMSQYLIVSDLLRRT
ncbi:MAG TPA: glucose-6-phosphate isomerase, partial [Clostridia bacterium]|nr:glucose-6-phosphate isomerase [Clostridia bacterium]